MSEKENKFIGSEAAIPNPKLKVFSILIGTWTTLGKHPMFPETTFHGRVAFDWIEGGAFLIMRTEIDEPGIPSGLSIIGSDDNMPNCLMLYFDERGVSRKYEVQMTGNSWKWWRNTPNFSQRFTSTISNDGNAINGSGELSKDGATWEKDLELIYSRVK